VDTAITSSISNVKLESGEPPSSTGASHFTTIYVLYSNIGSYLKLTGVDGAIAVSTSRLALYFNESHSNMFY
jgi:hypothetical protein